MLLYLCRSRRSALILHQLKMATTAISGMQIAMSRPCISPSQKSPDSSTAVFGNKSRAVSWNKISSASHIAPVQPLQWGFKSSSIKFHKTLTKAVSESSESKPVSGLPIDLKGYSVLPLNL